jgi:large subunit ribosomal protein L4
MPEAPTLGGGNAVALDADVFEQPFNGPLVHEVVIAELAARRQGTHATKTRGMVRGGGAKPWRQKGTGRARAGSSRSPIWTGGGTVFGPQPHKHTFKVNRKERRAALRSALSVHAERGTIHAIDPAPFVDEVSAKKAAALLGDLLGGSVLVILTDEHERAALSFRNIARVSVLPAGGVGVVDVIGAAAIVASKEALAELAERANKVPTRRSDTTASEASA